MLTGHETSASTTFPKMSNFADLGIDNAGDTPENVSTLVGFPPQGLRSRNHNSEKNPKPSR
jgi:hypothetical protein